MFKTGQADWPRMKTGFEQMTKEYPDAWNLNNFAKFACLARDQEMLSALLPKIGDAPIVLAWENDIRFYNACRSWATRVQAGKR